MKSIDMDNESMDCPTSKIEVSIYSIGRGDVSKEDVDGWMSSMVREIYDVVRSNSPNDRDIKVEVVLNEKGNANHLRH
jgi:hypothetical protein